MHKESFIINRNTLLHVSTLLGYLQENFLLSFTKVALYSWVRTCWCLRTVCTGGVNSLRSRPAGLQAGTAEGSCLQKQRSIQSTARSHSIIKCNLSVTITKSSPWRWPSRIETCRSVLRLMSKLTLCVCWWLVFLFSCIWQHKTFSCWLHFPSAIHRGGTLSIH
jgi:hypothetical protein